MFRSFLAGPCRVLVAWCSVAAAAACGQTSGPITIDSVVLRPSIEAEVPARHVGVLARLAVDEGAAVVAGDVLATLDDRAAILAVRQAEIERAQANAAANNRLTIQYADKALEVARAEFRRSQESNDKFPNSISNSQLDVERLSIEKLELEREQAVHELELAGFDLQLKDNALSAAQLELELHAVRAPFSGVVSLVRAHVGEWMEPGTPVLRVVAVDVLRAEGFAHADVVTPSMLGATAQILHDRTGVCGHSRRRSAGLYQPGG